MGMPGNGKGTNEVLEAIASLRTEMDERFSKMDERFSKMDERFSKMEALLTGMGTRLDNALLADGLTGAHYQDLGARVAVLDRKP